MKIESILAQKLSAEHVAAWSRIQRGNAMYNSPYFRPEFTQAVAAVRDDVEVAVMEQGGEFVGFFPFQRDSRNIAHPVGGKLSDFQGVVADSKADWNARQLLRECKLTAWHFDHMMAAQPQFQPYHWETAESPYVDVSGGADAYLERAQTLHKERFKRFGRKFRGIAKKFNVAMKFSVADDSVFEAMVRWKIDQYNNTGVPNTLAYPWVMNLLRQVLATQTEGFSGMLSALYFDGNLVAAKLSMRSYDVVHAWYSAYDPAYAQHSPGLFLWIELFKACADSGVQRVHMGKGHEEHKAYLMTGAVNVAEGSVDTRLVTNLVRRNWQRTYDILRRSPLRKPLLGPARLIRRMVLSGSYR